MTNQIEVREAATGNIVKFCKTMKSAIAWCSRKNQEYGAVRYTVNGIGC